MREECDDQTCPYCNGRLTGLCPRVIARPHVEPGVPPAPEPATATGEPPPPGATHRHYKGDYYRVLHSDVHDANNGHTYERLSVVYQHCNDGYIAMRYAEEFYGLVVDDEGREVDRFKALPVTVPAAAPAPSDERVREIRERLEGVIIGGSTTLNFKALSEFRCNAAADMSYLLSRLEAAEATIDRITGILDDDRDGKATRINQVVHGLREEVAK